MSSASTALLRACSLLLCLVAGTRQFTITEFSVPNAVLLGDKAELRCQYQLAPGENDAALYVKWWWTPTSASKYDRKQIYQRIAGRVAESLHHDNSSKIEILPNDTIVLTEVSPVDSGMYECEVSNIDEIRKRDKLIVYTMGTGPILNVTEIEDPKDLEKTVLLIECQAENVAPEPLLIVLLDGKEVNTTTYVEDYDHDGLYTIFVNATHDIEGKDPKNVHCEMFYVDDSITHTPYAADMTFVPTGCDTQSTTEMPEDKTQPESTPESLQNPRDDAIRLHSSWLVLASVAFLAHLQSIL